MLLELPKESFARIRPLLGGVSHYLVLTTLLEGRTPGKVWVNCLEEPTAALVWDRLNAFFFLVGDSTDNALNQALNRLIIDSIFPEAIQLQYRKFFLQFNPPTWEEKTGVLLERSSPSRESIYGYTLDPDHAHSPLSWEPRLPAGYRMARITHELLNSTNPKNLAEIVYCIRACWRSTDHYLNSGGIGYCLLRNDVIASWCSTDYVIGHECELYVETFEGYQRKGLGTLAALACVQECVARGLTVHWHCFQDNLGSVKVAEKTGLTRTAVCPVYVVDLQTRSGGGAWAGFAMTR
jgi:RimJ/RimL family protein N-acetyltransferase